MKNVNLIIAGKSVSLEQLKNQKEVSKMIKQAVGLEESAVGALKNDVKHSNQLGKKKFPNDKFEKSDKQDLPDDVKKSSDENTYIMYTEPVKRNFEKCNFDVEEKLQDIMNLLKSHK